MVQPPATDLLDFMGDLWTNTSAANEVGDVAKNRVIDGDVMMQSQLELPCTIHTTVYCNSDGSVYLPTELVSTVTPGMNLDVNVVRCDAQDSAEPNTSSASKIAQSAVQHDTSEVGDKLLLIKDYDVESDLSEECPESISMSKNDAEKTYVPLNKSKCPSIQREKEMSVPRSKRKRDPDQWKRNKAKRMRNLGQSYVSRSVKTTISSPWCRHSPRVHSPIHLPTSSNFSMLLRNENSRFL